MPPEPTPGAGNPNPNPWYKKRSSIGLGIAAALLLAFLGGQYFRSTPAAVVAPVVAEKECKCEKPVAKKPASPRPQPAPSAKAPTICCVPVATERPAPIASAQQGSYEIVISFASWSEEIRPAFAGGRVNGRLIGQAMQAGKVTRYSEPAWIKLVSADGAAVRLKSELRERGGMQVNEVVYPMPREVASNFAIQNIVLESNGFVTPRNQFVADEIRSSVARGSERIVFFVVRLPPNGHPSPQL